MARFLFELDFAFDAAARALAQSHAWHFRKIEETCRDVLLRSAEIVMKCTADDIRSCVKLPVCKLRVDELHHGRITFPYNFEDAADAPLLYLPIHKMDKLMQDIPHIVVVDDHKDIRDLVGKFLSQQGYRISLAESGAALRHILERNSVQLIVLDIMMPGEDGLSLCRYVRSSTEIPIIFLTAMAEDMDRIIGLELGADDYLVKPFNPRELLARIRAVLRRVNSLPPQHGRSNKNTVIRFDHWRLDLGRQELTDSDGVTTYLSTAEFRLLTALLERPGIVLNREQLLDLTAGRTADVFDRSIDNHVSRLRKKLELDPKNPSIIKTHWGGGYSLSANVVEQ